MPPFVIASLYKFQALPAPEPVRERLFELCCDHRISGTLLLASEGINGTIAGSREGIDTILDHIRSLPGFEDLEHKESQSDDPPFHRLKVKVKDEIVTIRDSEVTPHTQVGTYVEPEDWNALISDPDVILVDTRNDYEVKIGSFEGAIDPKLANFSDFPAWAEANLDSKQGKKVAMFCTGGIRCEKASSLLLREGFEEVFHLRGGILRYLENVPQENSKWEGECFVFDQRVAVNHSLEPGVHSLCFGCQQPLTPEDREHSDYELGVRCPHCAPHTNEDTLERRRERTRQVKLAESRGKRHIGRQD